MVSGRGRPALVLALFAAGGVRLIKRRREALRRLPPPRTAPLPLTVAQVRVGSLEVTEHYLGLIRPLLSARLSSRLSGYLLEVRKYEGDPVKKGEVLARIDDHELRARIEGLETGGRGGGHIPGPQTHLRARPGALRKQGHFPGGL
ncbi:MAG: hypothetical protein DSZ24_02025 [Thermodesulfatator sp.]|nr:MAG: hypothetical protein DSZ24_02025 [Thermodesulfatator sp.]